MTDLTRIDTPNTKTFALVMTEKEKYITIGEKKYLTENRLNEAQTWTE